MNALPRIAFRNVLRNRRRSVITFGAILLSVAVLITLRGLANGMIASVGDTMVQGQSGALQVHRQGYRNDINGTSLELNVPADPEFLAKIVAVPGVKAVAPRIAFGAMANAHDTTTPALFTALDPVRENQVCPRRVEMASQGKRLDQAGPTAAVLTPELASSLGIKFGETATLMGNDVDGALNALELEYVGTYGQSGPPLPEKKVGFVPFAFAQELLRMEGRATELAVAINDLRELEAVKDRLQAALGPEYEVVTWRTLAPFLEDVTATYDFMLGLLSGIFLFVALLGIVNTMLMSVFERTREIGTMMSVGARRRQILGLFLLEAGLLGFCGGVLGAVGGQGLLLTLGRESGIALHLAGMSAPIHIFPTTSLTYSISMIALATGGAVLAALWPSLRASRLRPVQALASV